jgi:hypothetical protein
LAAGILLLDAAGILPSEVVGIFHMVAGIHPLLVDNPFVVVDTSYLDSFDLDYFLDYIRTLFLFNLIFFEIFNDVI